MFSIFSISISFNMRYFIIYVYDNFIIVINYLIYDFISWLIIIKYRDNIFFKINNDILIKKSRNISFLTYKNKRILILLKIIL